MKRNASALIALSLGLLASSTAHAGQWRVVDMPWKGKPGALGAGTLGASLVTEGSGNSSQSPDGSEWSSVQMIVLKRKAAWVQAGPCSIVGNLDTNAGHAGAVLLSDGRHVMVQLRSSISFMTKPRICIAVEHE